MSTCSVLRVILTVKHVFKLQQSEDGMNETPFRRMQQLEKDDDYKMSKDNLVGDIVAVIRAKYGTKDPPPIVLVGHSLGGALAVHCAQKKGDEGIPSLGILYKFYSFSSKRY